MFSISNKGMRIGLVTLAVLLFSMTLASADLFVRREMVIYEGRSLDQTNMTIGGWGSGLCRESTNNTSAGNHSVRITANDLFSGARLDFPVPIDLTEMFDNDEHYLQFVTKFWGVQASQDALGITFGSPGSADMYGGAQRPGRQVRTVRVILFFEDGHLTEAKVPLSCYRLGTDGWMNVSFPLAAFKRNMPDASEFQLNRIVITADGSEPFHIGEIRIVRCSVELEADAGGDKQLSRNYPVVFQGFARQGASAVEYSWDFNRDDGIQAQAVGDMVYRTFNRAGEFVVTFTVSDYFGIKKSATDTAHVIVNE